MDKQKPARILLSKLLRQARAMDKQELVKHYYPDEQVLPEKELEIRSIARQIHAPHKP
jgi:hypothetical protein